jgi:hypothetical protein
MFTPESAPFLNASQTEPTVVGLQRGAVQHDLEGNPQVYFGSSFVEYLRPYETATLRDGQITINMFTIVGNDEADYAEITIKTPLTDRSATERGIALRSGGTKPADLIERTPVQYFTSDRAFMDIPLSGRARWLAVSPEGDFSEGLFDDRDTQTQNNPFIIGNGWTFVWIVEGSRPFTFGELCSPRFIDESEAIPTGEAGIKELEEPRDLQSLPPAFQEKFALYTSGEHLRIQAA